MSRKLPLLLRVGWQRPVDGVSVYYQGARRRPVLAPTTVAADPWAEFEPDAGEQGQLLRALQRLRVERDADLAGFASEWGFFYDDGDREPIDGGRALFTEEGAVVPASKPRQGASVERGGKLVHYQPIENFRWYRFLPLDGVREEVQRYLDALGRFARLKRLSSAERESEDRALRALVARQLVQHGLGGIDSESLAWIVGSPLALAWQQLRELLLGGGAPRLCDLCQRPFTPSPSDRARDKHPPRFCSETCRANAARRRLRRGGKKRRPGRRKKPEYIDERSPR